jgi:hypothetical protein
MEGKNIKNLKIITEAFNNYFSRVADSIHDQIKEDGTSSKIISPTECLGNYMTYMTKAFDSPFPEIQIMKTTSFEIERIIESLLG